jgi:hypothetical protein
VVVAVAPSPSSVSTVKVYDPADVSIEEPLATVPLHDVMVVFAGAVHV